MRKAQTNLCDNTLKGDLAYLCAHFKFLGDMIEELECLSITLAQNVGPILDNRDHF